MTLYRVAYAMTEYPNDEVMEFIEMNEEQKILLIHRLEQGIENDVICDLFVYPVEPTTTYDEFISKYKDDFDEPDDEPAGDNPWDSAFAGGPYSGHSNV